MTRLTQKSFTGGELSPSLYARNDLAKYSNGLKKLLNGFVRAEGCVSNRAGLEYVCEAKDSSKPVRIIPFSFNTEQTYIIELGDKYARFVKDNGQIVYPDNYGWTYKGTYTHIENGTEDISDVYDGGDYKNASNIDVVDGGSSTLVYSDILDGGDIEDFFSYYKYRLSNGDEIYTSSTIALGVICYSDVDFKNIYEGGISSQKSKGIITSINYSQQKIGIDEVSADVALQGTPVEIEMPYNKDDLFKIKYGQNADVLTICHNNYTAKELSRYNHYDWRLNDIISSPQIEPPTNLNATWTGDKKSNTTTYTYVVTAVKNETYEESERSQEVSQTGHLESFWTTSEKMTITWEAVENAVEYNIYRSVNGIFGYVGTSTNTEFTDNKIEPDLTSTAPITRDPFENNNNPACVNYFQQRKLFGCLKNAPQTMVTSQTGTDNNFNISRPLNASDSITIRLSEREVNEIRHLIGLNDLIVLTSGAEWKLQGSDGTFSAASPPLCVPQSYYGCSHVQPCVSGNMVLFVQAGGSVVRDLGYEYVSNSYNGDELTIFASHLFENKQVVDMAYSKEPYRILWCVMSDGTVNALTYNKKQEVAGWHKHTTDGYFESVAVVREGFEDVAYFVVRREINGQTKRFIERMHSRLIDNAEDGFFVDCGLEAEFVNEVTHISGLSHLEGKNVMVLADGGVYETKVKNGAINLEIPAKKIKVGLPYTFELETLNIEGENTHGLKKIITAANIKVEKSREDFFVVGDDGTESQQPRSVASVMDAGYLFSGDITVYPNADYKEDASISIKQPYPLPITVTSISAVVTIEDEDTDVQSEQN